MGDNGSKFSTIILVLWTVTFFGTQRTTVPIYTPFFDDEIKGQNEMHVSKQDEIGQHITSCKVTRVQITSWAENTTHHTLHRQLMIVEIVYEKEVDISKSK